jgi:hypothetical protein
MRVFMKYGRLIDICHNSKLMSFACKLYIGAVAWKIEHIKKGLGSWEFS